MGKLIIMGLLLTVPGFGATACNGRGVDRAKLTNSAEPVNSAELANNIQSKLATDAQLNTANLKISADASKKVAMISGTVESESLRSKAVDLAKSGQPDVKILDQIEIAPTDVTRNDYEEQKAEEEWAKTKRLEEQGGSRLDDAWIHGKIVAKLVATSKVSPRTVSVDVTNNVVTLRGTVPEAEQKAEAERIAKETSGVRRVDNEIQISS